MCTSINIHDVSSTCTRYIQCSLRISARYDGDIGLDSGEGSYDIDAVWINVDSQLFTLAHISLTNQGVIETHNM